MVDLKLNSVNCDTGRISYYEGGKGSRNLLFLHGGFGNPDIAQVIARGYEEEDYRIVAPYLPAHGLSDSVSGNYTFSDLVSTTQEFIDKLSFNNCFVIAHSMAAALLWELSNCDKNEIEKAALNCPLFVPPHDTWMQALSLLGMDAIRERKENGRNKEIQTITSLRGPKLKNLKQVWTLLRTMGVTNEQNPKTEYLVMWGKKDPFYSRNIEYIKILKPKKFTYKYFDGGHLWFRTNLNTYLNTIGAYFN